MSISLPRWSCGREPQTHKVPSDGSPGLAKVPSFEAVRIYSIACFACWQVFYLPSFCLPDSFNFIFPTLLWSSAVIYNYVLNSESEFRLVFRPDTTLDGWLSICLYLIYLSICVCVCVCACVLCMYVRVYYIYLSVCLSVSVFCLILNICLSRRERAWGD